MKTVSSSRLGHVERDAPLLDRAEQVLVRLERALEQVGEVDDAAVAVDQLALDLVQRQRLQRRRQRRQRAIHRELARARVDRQLRLDGGHGLAVAARDEEALDLDVAQHLGEVAVVRREQRLEDLPVAVRQIAVGDVVGGAKTVAGFAGQSFVDEGAALGPRQEQQRVIAQLVDDLRLDELVVEVGVGVDGVADRRSVRRRRSRCPPWSPSATGRSS